MPDEVFEVSAVPQGVAHVLVIRTLGVEDFIQCPHSFVRCPTGSSGRWLDSVHLLARPFFPALVRLLVRIPPWCGWRRFCASDEVLGPLIHGDVDVRLPNNCSEVAGAFLKGKCALGPFLSILVIECQHKYSNVNLCP
jgi:hypothetical protein